MNDFEISVCNHLDVLPARLKDYMRRDFERDHFVVLDQLLPPEMTRRIEEEALRLLGRSAERRDLVIEGSGNTPRAYNSVGRDAIRQSGKFIPAFFDSPAILDFLSEIAGERLHKVPYAPEEFIINSQERRGDTHGWHWDDYGYALIWVVESPDALSGGRVEFIPRVPWLRENTEQWLRDVLSSRHVRSHYVRPGQCYFMKANTTLHRVSPLTGETRRTVIVYSYASDADLSDATISHESMEAIYPKDTTAGVDAAAERAVA
jgi:hypothetical protein